MRSVLITRICRLLILVASNIGFHPVAKNEVRLAISRSLTGPGDIHTNLCVKFARTESWKDLENALTFSPLNRGADELVYLALRTNFSHPRFIKGVKIINYSTVGPELEQLLSQNGPASAKRPGAGLDPGAKPFTPPVQAEPPADNIEEPTEADQAADQPEADTFAQSQVDYLSSVPKEESERILTPEDVNMGKKILLCYRRYALRQRVKARLSVRIIWAYYSRYRLRHKAPRTATGDRIRKLHNDYKQDVDSIDVPLLLAKGFRRHERILLGFMPHVAVYVRGLDDINQQQKDGNKKRLQKVQHEELEKLQSKMNACSAFSKKLKPLTRNIMPGSSALHKIDSLREQVKKADEIRSGIIQAFGEDAIPADLEQHYSLGIQAILSPPPTKTEPKPLRPELNTSDLDGIY